ncbi:unnamed protein product [Rotaria sordida]|uniref:F-box domain-containing protein n=1 Tax=Rotaria sordida TaxID=392033 RepID=A0A815IH00_9BILA|nr:unnamed protein product [Rotaria sordida]
MSTEVTPPLLTLPVEIVYRILDHLQPLTIFLSCRNVCTRLNTIIDTYQRYHTLTKLNFSFQHFNGPKLQRLCYALQNNTTITDLDLPENEIDFHGAQYLAVVLLRNHTLTSLNLNCNNIGLHGLQNLANALHSNQVTSVNTCITYLN